jgi:hypothetical protein
MFLISFSFPHLFSFSLKLRISFSIFLSFIQSNHWELNTKKFVGWIYLFWSYCFFIIEIEIRIWLNESEIRPKMLILYVAGAGGGGFSNFRKKVQKIWSIWKSILKLVISSFAEDLEAVHLSWKYFFNFGNFSLSFFFFGLIFRNKLIIFLLKILKLLIFPKAVFRTQKSHFYINFYLVRLLNCFIFEGNWLLSLI